MTGSVPDRGKPRDPPPIDPGVIQSLWGTTAQATGVSSVGVSAALWALRDAPTLEIVRPACSRTHVLSLWPTGHSSSDFYLDGRRRFSDMRHPGNFQLARAGETVRAILTRPTGSCLDIYLPSSVLENCLDAEFEGEKADFCLLPLKLEADEELTNLAQLIRREVLDHAPGSRAVMDGVSLLLSAMLIRRWSNRAQSLKLPKAGLADWQKRRAISRLRDDLQNEAAVADIAKDVGMSPFHFARSFKNAVGMSPHQYRIEQRMQKARALLETTSLDVTAVAASIGYDDPSYFSRIFRRRLGASPHSYRLKYLKP